MTTKPKDSTHQSLTSEHYTPPWVIEMARYIMGKIHLDPFTSEAVNNWSVKALTVCDKKDCGFDYLKKITCHSHPWGYKTFCNPPSSKAGDSARAFRLLHEAWMCGAVDQAVFVAFNLETVDQCCELTHKLPRLQLRQRIKYWSWHKVFAQFREGQWQKKGDGKYYVHKSSNSDYWKVIDKDFSIHSQHATKDEAIAATNGNYLIWTNSPTKHSTILLLPPRTNSGWSECLERAQSFKLPVEGYWNIPQFPKDLGAK